MWNFFSKTKHYTAEDVHAEVIASTLVILERIKVNVEKASLPAETSKEKELLNSLGLTNSKNMQIIKEAEAKINVHNAIIEDNIRITKIMDEMYRAFGNNTFYVPMKAFSAILDKYNLSVGRLADYKGTIPEANVLEIARAKGIINNMKRKHRCYHVRYNPAPWEDPEYLVEEYEDKSFPILQEGIDDWYRLEKVHARLDKPEYKRFPMVKANIARSYNRWDMEIDYVSHNLLIAAPVQEMNTLYDIEERIITDDPIVFSTIGNGVIIYSMWGDEGNDEVLKKYQELNKFITENVNLGTPIES